MNISDFENNLIRAVYKNYYLLQKQLPYKTGNLAYNALKIKKTSKGYDIIIDQSIAPYASYIDKPEYKSYQYWDKAVKNFIKQINKDLGGTIEIK